MYSYWHEKNDARKKSRPWPVDFHKLFPIYPLLYIASLWLSVVILLLSFATSIHKLAKEFAYGRLRSCENWKLLPRRSTFSFVVKKTIIVNKCGWLSRRIIPKHLLFIMLIILLLESAFFCVRYLFNYMGSLFCHRKWSSRPLLQ